MLAPLLEGLAGIGARAATATGDVRILSDRADGSVVRVGDVVVKAHAEDTLASALASRVALVHRRPLRAVFVEPLSLSEPMLRVDDRWVTVWRAGTPVDPDVPDSAPWQNAARLLARLHRIPLDELGALDALPLAGGARRFARAMDRLGDTPGEDADAVRDAAAALGGVAQLQQRNGRPQSMVHGDFHLGQLVRLPSIGEDGWRLIDVDDLGLGDPAWDLARPAAWFALGMLSGDAWLGFLKAYCATGGIAVTSPDDPWPALDLPARAMTVQAAALALARARGDGRELDEIERVLVGACRRMLSA